MYKDSHLQGKHALITGGGGGIGAAIARALAAEGAVLTLLGRNQTALDSTVGSLNKEGAKGVLTRPCDVTDQDSVAEVFARAVERFGPVEILVNCAGVAPTAAFHKLDYGQWKNTFAVNVDGVFHCSQAVYPSMQKNNWGRIINIASTASLRGYAYVSAYCAAKHAVLGLTRSLALEAATTGITVNAICPGYTDTDMIRDAVDNIVSKTGRSEQDARQAFIRANPQGRLIDPGEVAATVLWLCQPSSASITGQAIAIAGGEVM